jgi:hypothetical protein
MHTFVIKKHFGFIQYEKSLLPKEFIIGTFFFKYTWKRPLFILIFTKIYFIFIFLFIIFLFLLIIFLHNKNLRLIKIQRRFINNQSMLGLRNLNADLIILEMHFLFFITILFLWISVLEIELSGRLPELLGILLFQK